MPGSVIPLCNLDPNDIKDTALGLVLLLMRLNKGFPTTTDNKIRHLGRWKSDAFKKYIRITSLESVS